ncbi:DUF2871 domain-containing protein [Planctomonas sp. JC2975]|uniref:DUF2871 domain-containing protein n=1 Tax=Planctomonas sp. JC2975 TaxID=2729626 RepID=UPI0014755900|nr:DUF2871 domain-containing protein [Planctomonas sp. JC2975]NNC11066.1 DUF2871 domain-containing protein [Planctomonas sp. JC2975]
MTTATTARTPLASASEHRLFVSAAVWTGVGLAGGLAFREVTKATGFDGSTELAVVHTHALVLGTVVLLAALALDRLFHLGADRRMRWFLWIWNIGLAVTVGSLALKGTLQILVPDAADSPAIAGIAGMGHILLTVAFVLFFLALGRGIKAGRGSRRAAAEGAPRDLDAA